MASPPEHPSLALIILDGLGDRPHPDTADRSPVEAASTPNLDRLAAEGAMGAVTVVAPGVAPESDAGVLALLGYDPVSDSPGRGVLEALGVGIDLAPGDVAFRLNFATLDGGGGISDSRVGRSLGTSEAGQLARSLTSAHLLESDSVRAEVRATVGHRGVLWLHPESGGPLSPNVSNSDPFYEKVGGMGQARRVESPRPLEVRPLDDSPEARRTATVTNRFLDRAVALLGGETVNARRALAGKKIANGLLVRNAGSMPSPGSPAPFISKYGFAGTAITEMPVERGIARLLGLQDAFIGPMGADVAGALKVRARATRDAVETYPFVYVHLKGPDEPGHDGQALRKKEIVEELDRSFFGPFLDGLDRTRVRLAITADHATPCILKGHSDDPVPLVLTGSGVAPGGGRAPTSSSIKFGETSAAAGSLGALRGRDVLPLLIRGGVAHP
ncbi:MAG TPA: alkaline phosphatase family protein [Thermoplasmata archaeon]|nr:alkaline phosphatase family protein [Thermoplasmata archaeon]